MRGCAESCLSIIMHRLCEMGNWQDWTRAVEQSGAELGIDRSV